MAILLCYGGAPAILALHRRPSPMASSSLPFTDQKAKYYQHLEIAVDVVERACRLCVDVQRSLLSSDGKIVQKIDSTPVTIADFGVQALISLELSLQFPSIPLVAEEDSGFVRKSNLVDAVFHVVRENSTWGQGELSHDMVLKAIDRGGKDALSHGPEPTTYWVLDPIDGTRGFVKGGEALYVVGLALVVEGEIVLGVMGCPNWKNDNSENFDDEDSISTSGIIMIAHVGCGTWRSRLSSSSSQQCFNSDVPNNWIRCSVDTFRQIHEASFCIPESKTWESFPLSKHFTAIPNARIDDRNQVLLLPTCCGSLCKYLMVASGRASAFILGSKWATSIKVWDHAVGVVCVQEAGGKVSDWKGTKLNFSADGSHRRVLVPQGGILVSNGSLHHLLLQAIV